MNDRQWFDTYARHMVDTELYAEARTRLLGDTLDKMFRELRAIVSSYGTIRSRADESRCMRECDDCVRKYLSEWEDDEERERSEYAEKEADWLSGAVKAALGVSVLWGAAKILRALATPFSTADTFRSFVERMREDIVRAVRAPLLSSRIFGSPASAATEPMRSSFDKIKRQAEADMRTAVTGLQRNVTYQLLEDKRRLRMVYVSMLDDKTCVVCAGYSGNVYEDLSKAPAVPVHIRCRCYYMPVLSSGEVPKKETYGEWFGRQPDSVKYRILGPTRYNFYKGGNISINKFSSDGRKLTLKELFDGKIKKRAPKSPESKMWHKEKVSKNSNLYIAQERLDAGMKDPAVYSSDKMMAKTLARETGKDVYLLPETNKDSPNPDGFFDGKPIEFKHVIGGMDKVGKNAIKALKQSQNIFLYIKQDLSYKSCLDKIKGSLKAYIGTSKSNDLPYIMPDKEAFIYMYTEGEIHVAKWKDVF